MLIKTKVEGCFLKEDEKFNYLRNLDYLVGFVMGQISSEYKIPHDIIFDL